MLYSFVRLLFLPSLHISILTVSTQEWMSALYQRVAWYTEQVLGVRLTNQAAFPVLPCANARYQQGTSFSMPLHFLSEMVVLLFAQLQVCPMNEANRFIDMMMWSCCWSWYGETSWYLFALVIDGNSVRKLLLPLDFCDPLPGLDSSSGTKLAKTFLVVFHIYCRLHKIPATHQVILWRSTCITVAINKLIWISCIYCQHGNRNWNTLNQWPRSRFETIECAAIISLWSFPVANKILITTNYLLWQP